MNTGIDLLPTMLEFAGLEVPKKLPGRSLMPWVLGQPVTDWRDHLVVENDMNQAGELDGLTPRLEGRMVRTDRFKYCLYSRGQQRESIVDMQADPGEMTNLATDLDYRAVLLQHRELLARFGREHREFLTKIQGKYHLFVTGRLKRLGLGRTGLPEGVNDVLVAASEKPDSGFSPFYVAFPYAGQTTLFSDASGALWATFSGADERALFRGKPGAFKVEQVPATQPRWPIGFAGEDAPTRFPLGLMLRPDTSFIYERGMGAARGVPLDKVPGQKADVPWIRDTFIMLGHDGNYYLTGTSGNMDGINLWRSPDLKRFTFVKQVWTPEADPGKWYNAAPRPSAPRRGLCRWK